MLAGCSSTGGSSSDLMAGFTGSADAPDIDPNYFLTSRDCPPVLIRAGAESVRLYENKHEGDPEFLRFQGTISSTARECTGSETTLNIKLGVRGRAVAGPKGGAGIVNLPVRVAVVKQSTTDVLFSELYSVPVTLSPPNYGTDYAQVFETISFPVSRDDGDLIIYAGFDKGAKR